MDITPEVLRNLPSQAKKIKDSNSRFFRSLRKKRPKDLDSQVHAADAKVFEDINCLECANCCKTISPVLKERDIQRLSKIFSLSPADFIDDYLYLDYEGDYVLKSAPCPFLLKDNKCMVYDHRPEACRSYPHTGRRKFHQLFNITEKNVATCPAVFRIVERLKEIYR